MGAPDKIHFARRKPPADGGHACPRCGQALRDPVTWANAFLPANATGVKAAIAACWRGPITIYGIAAAVGSTCSTRGHDVKARVRKMLQRGPWRLTTRREDGEAFYVITRQEPPVE